MNNNLTPAATVLVLRDTNDGMEVLMVIKRSKKSPFGNLYVFPGGKIDDGDCLESLDYIVMDMMI